jgi:thiamine biosynthesis protein ThiI
MPKLILRYSGEVNLKDRQPYNAFITRLHRNASEALANVGVEAKLHRQPGRSELTVAEEQAEAAEAALARVFGVARVYQVARYPEPTLDRLISELGHRFAEAVRAKTFAVRVTRRGGQRPVNGIASDKLKKKLGRKLLPRSTGVNLDNPEVRIPIELYPQHVDLVVSEQPGPGGLPLGVSGHAVALISGGVDSVVAAWEMMKRGVDLDFVYCDLADTPTARGVHELVAALRRQWGAGSTGHFHQIAFESIVGDLCSQLDKNYWQIALRNAMCQAGEGVAREIGGLGLVTGEAVGQVSTQTLQSVRALDRHRWLPHLRPLLTANKHEVVEKAKALNVYEPVRRVPEVCAIGGKAALPSIKAQTLDKALEKLDDQLVEQAVQQRTVLPANDPDQASADADPGPIGEDAVVLDLRDEAAYSPWAELTAVNLPFERAIRQYHLLPRDRSYRLYCDVEFKSKVLARQMAASDYDARPYNPADTTAPPAGSHPLEQV